MRNFRQANQGYTLIELILVTFVIVMLASMLIPAIQGSRPAPRRNQCINNNRNVGLALLQFEGSANRFPGYCNNQGGFDSLGRALNKTPTGWVVPILGYLDRKDLQTYYGASGAGAGVVPKEHLKILVCNDDAEAINNGASLSYAVNAGLPGDDGGPDETSAGVFTHQFKATKDTPVQSMNVQDIADGAATTILFGENIDSTVWTSGAEKDVAIVWQTSAPAAGSNQNHNVLGGTCPGSCPRPSSSHAGGAVFTFCDGHSVFVSEDIAYRVYQQLMTPRGRAFNQSFLDETSY